MAVGDIALDSSGNRVLDGAGNRMLKRDGDCAPCCGCAAYYEITACSGGAKYYVCCKGDPPEIGTVFAVGGFDTLDADGDTVHVYAGCFTVTSGCAGLPMGGAIVGALEEAPDGVDCSQQYCKPCPDAALCKHITLDFAGIAGAGCLFWGRTILFSPCGMGDTYVDNLSPPSGRLYLDTGDFGIFPGGIVDGFLTGLPSSHSNKGHEVGKATGCSGAGYPFTFFDGFVTQCWGTKFFFEPADVQISISVGCLTVSVSILVGDFTPPFLGLGRGSTVIPFWFQGSAIANITPGGDTVIVVSNSNPSNAIATGGTVTVTISCTPPTAYCFYTYSAVCSGGAWVVSFVSAVCSRSDLASGGWIPNGTDTDPSMTITVRGGTCDYDSPDCSAPSEGDYPDPPTDASPCQANCYDTYQAVCSGDAWTVSYVSSTCSVADISQDWMYTAAGFEAGKQFKIVKGTTCTVGGDACTQSTSPPAAPPDTADCDAWCIQKWLIVYDCVHAEWAEPTVLAHYCGVDEDTDWIAIADTFPPAFTKIVRGMKCTGGGSCTADITHPPDPPADAPECDGMVCLYVFQVDCNGGEAYEPVSLVDTSCGLASDAHGWALYDAEDDFFSYRKIVAGDSCAVTEDCLGDAPDAPAPPDETCGWT